MVLASRASRGPNQCALLFFMPTISANILRHLLATLVAAGGLSVAGAARAVTFDIGVGDFPRSFSTLDNELASIVDSTAIVMVGARVDWLLVAAVAFNT